MKMTISTEPEEGAHLVSEDLYKAVLVLLENKSFPQAYKKQPCCSVCGNETYFWKCRVCGHDDKPSGSGR